MSETTRTWSLASVKAIDDASFPIPPHTQVGDYRLDAKDLHLMLFPPKGAEPVLYLWQGRLPTLDELRRMRSGESIAMSAPNNTRWILPGSLVLLGFVWLGYSIRKRAAKKE